MSPEALLSNPNIATEEPVEGQHDTCAFTQERGSIMLQSQENGEKGRFSHVASTGKYETDAQYSSPSQTNSHYRLTG